MELKDALGHLHKSKEFKEWKGKGVLAHAFKLLDEANEDSWQLGFYDKDAEKITTFVVSPRFVEVIPDQDILRSETDILELLPAQVTVTSEKALAKATEYHQLHYPREMVLKKFFILQQIESGPVYNITFFFQSMKTLNVKVDAGTCMVLSQSFQSLMEMDKPLKK